MFIFVLFKQTDRLKIVDFSRIRTRIVEEEGRYTDHLTTATAKPLIFFKWAIVASFLFRLFDTVIVKLPITGFEPHISGVGSNRSTTCATTTALMNFALQSLNVASLPVETSLNVVVVVVDQIFRTKLTFVASSRHVTPPANVDSN